MKDYHVNVFYSDEDGGYIADIPDLQCCSAFGKTPAEALSEVEEGEGRVACVREKASPGDSEANLSPGNLSTSRLTL